MDHDDPLPERPFSNAIIAWSQSHDRGLPWVGESDPYRIWLSEILLQQTRVEQGLPYYKRFIATFPTVHDLAQAPEAEVLKAWQGLGYYRRAHNLMAAARNIVQRGDFPTTAAEWMELPGVGPYTAAAIASFAFGEATPVVDGNVRRVAARYFADNATTDAGWRKLLAQYIDRDRPAAFNQAMMDLGATVCTPRKPNCNGCPLSSDCRAFNLNKVDFYPAARRRSNVRDRYFHYLVPVDPDGAIGIKQRLDDDIWQGLHDFPLIEAGHSLSMQAVSRKFGVGNLQQAGTLKQLLSHQRIHASFFVAHIENRNAYSPKGGAHQLLWVPESRLGSFAIPKIISNFLNSSMLEASLTESLT